MVSWIDDVVTRAVVGALSPLREFLLDAGSRYFWLYCVTGLVLAAYVYRKHKASGDFKSTLLERDVWLSASAINDYIIIMVAPVLRLTVLSWTVLNWRTVSDVTVNLLHSAGVTGTVTDSTAAGLGILLTLTLFIADDF